MPKPILVVNYCVDGLSWEMIVKNFKALRKVVEDSGMNEEYYSFFLPVQSDSHIQVFYDKDFKEASYEELKEEILHKIQELK